MCVYRRTVQPQAQVTEVTWRLTHWPNKQTDLRQHWKTIELSAGLQSFNLHLHSSDPQLSAGQDKLGGKSNCSDRTRGRVVTWALPRANTLDSLWGCWPWLRQIRGSEVAQPCIKLPVPSCRSVEHIPMVTTHGVSICMSLSGCHSNQGEVGLVEHWIVVSMLLVFFLVAFREHCLVEMYGGWVTPRSSSCITDAVCDRDKANAVSNTLRWCNTDVVYWWLDTCPGSVFNTSSSLEKTKWHLTVVWVK